MEEVGGSSSSTSPPLGVASSTPTSDEVYTIGSILPRTGPLLRALTRGGNSAAQATKELHRRWNHLPAREIQALYRKAGLDRALINETPKILEACKLCRMWDRLPPRQVAASEFAKSFNECLWLDLFFATLFCEGTPRDCTALHCLDEATCLCLLPLLLARTFVAIKQGILRWTEAWGFPAAIVADGEKGISSMGM